MNEETDDNVLASITFADLLPGETPRPFTLKQSLNWAKRNCTPEAVERLRSRAVVARLVEEIEKLQTLLQAIKGDLDEGSYISSLITQLLNTYFVELDKS